MYWFPYLVKWFWSRDAGLELGLRLSTTQLILLLCNKPLEILQGVRTF